MHPDFASVTIAGRNIRHLCQGEGAFTVVLDQGQGISVEEISSHRILFDWPKVFLAVRGVARAFIYDRAGLGWSDKAPEPRTGRDIADDLFAVLQTLSIPPPYILVGHSIGGFTVRQFAGGHPSEVAGIVLVDSAHPDQQARLSHLLPPPPPMPKRETLALHCLRASPSQHLPGGIDFERSAEQIRATSSLGNKPVIVVSRDFKPVVANGLEPEAAATIERVWSELQADLLRLSTNSSSVTAKGSGHHIQRDAPDIVIDAILTMLKRAEESYRFRAVASQ